MGGRHDIGKNGILQNDALQDPYDRCIEQNCFIKSLPSVIRHGIILLSGIMSRGAG